MCVVVLAWVPIGVLYGLRASVNDYPLICYIYTYYCVRYVYWIYIISNWQVYGCVKNASVI